MTCEHVGGQGRGVVGRQFLEGADAGAPAGRGRWDGDGWLIGEANRGLNHMFTFINTSRVGTAVQGVAAAELQFQCLDARATVDGSRPTRHQATSSSRLADDAHNGGIGVDKLERAERGAGAA